MNEQHITIADRKDRNLVLDILETGCGQLFKNESIKINIEDAFVIYVVESGSIVFEGKNYNGTVETGEMIVAFAYQQINLIGVGENTKVYSVKFTGYMIEIYLARGNLYRYSPKLENDKDNVLLKNIKEIYLKSQKVTNRYCKLASILYDTFYYLLDINKSKLNLNIRNNNYYLISLSLEKIRENFKKSFTITELADYCNLKPRQLTQAYKDVINITPKRFILLFRIQRACKLLRAEKNGKSTLETIATEVGFVDQYSFAKAFKKITGLTTLQYRRGEDWDYEIDCEEVYERLVNKVRYV